MDSLPLTSNCKVDRKALPVPDDLRPDLEIEYMAPRTPIEKLLAGIWSEVLGVPKVGIYDNFFELGGHSLLANHVISRLRGVLQMEIPLRLLFESPTVLDMAVAISLEQAEYAKQKDLKQILTDL
jgi:hypothetical protein